VREGDPDGHHAGVLSLTADGQTLSTRYAAVMMPQLEIVTADRIEDFPAAIRAMFG
jgi:hypothetical protein